MGHRKAPLPLFCPQGTLGNAYGFFLIFIFFETGSFCTDEGGLEIPIPLPQPVGWGDR